MYFQKLAGALLLVFTFSSGASASPLLTDDETAEVLQTIDNICGDTWCEGQSNWSFDDLSCDGATGCILKLTMKPYDYSDAGLLGPRPFVCRLPGFTAKASIAETTENGLHYTPGFYDAVSDCINGFSETYGPVYVPVDTSCPSLFNQNASSISHLVSRPLKAHGSYGAIEALTQLIRQQAKTDAGCVLDLKPYYRDRAQCLAPAGTSEVCVLPSLKGSYTITRDSHGGAVAVYVPKQADNRSPKIKINDSALVAAALPRIDLCSASLLKQSQIAGGAFSFTGAENTVIQSHYLDGTEGAALGDIRLRALNDINALVKAHAAADASSCQYEVQKFDLDSISCRKQKSTSLCSVPTPSGGFFHIIFDQENATQIIYNR